MEEPSYGYPADFWRPELTAADEHWATSAFVSSGRVSLNDAPYKVRRWLGNNDEASAEWVRSATDIQVNWNHVRDNLWSSGWQAWIAHAHEPKRPPKRSWHYQDALIRLIGLAVREPEAITSRARLFDELVAAFELYGDAPDTRELERLVAAISRAADPGEEELAPVD